MEMIVFIKSRFGKREMRLACSSGYVLRNMTSTVLARCTIRILRVVCTRAWRFRGASLRGSSTDLFSYVEAAAAPRVVTVSYSGTDAEARLPRGRCGEPGDRIYGA